MIAQEEIFGPVVAVMKAADLDEALAIANGVRYALTGGLISRSPATIARVRREFRVGNLYINRGITGALVERQPFGGFKMSGIGSKAGGPDYLLQFLEPRVITENTLRRGFAPPEDLLRGRRSRANPSPPHGVSPPETTHPAAGARPTEEEVMSRRVKITIAVPHRARRRARAVRRRRARRRLRRAAAAAASSSSGATRAADQAAGSAPPSR